jgi:hypothetical protein
MRFGELVQLYFDRSNALQSYWTLYVVVIGGLLAISALRSRPDFLAGILVTVLFLCFAYKNLGAIHDAIDQRQATLQAIQSYRTNGQENDVDLPRALLLPKLIQDDYSDTRTFHVICDVLTILTVWLMQVRRFRESRKLSGPSAPI